MIINYMIENRWKKQHSWWGCSWWVLPCLPKAITVDLTADYNTVPFDYAVISFANGMVTKPNLSSSLIEKYYITTGIANGIEDIREAGNSDADSIVTYYTIDGIQVSTPRKGFNIVKYSNGQKKKIFVK